MTPEQFFDDFGHLAEAPNGVQKLRELILQLAVRGKLVPQDPADEPAAKLLERIRAEKARLVKEKTIRNAEPLPPVKDNDAPYELPQGWEWSRVGTVVLQVTGGGTPSKQNSRYWGGDILWASVKDLGKGKYLDTTIDRITEMGLTGSSSNLVHAGRVIVCTRMGLGKIGINRVAMAINQDLKALDLSKSVDIDFFYNYYRTQNIQGSGMTVSGIRQDVLLMMFFPLPPLAEQQRIVAKVDQLMVLCDQLEARQQKSRQKLLRLNNAALDRLTCASGADDFSAAWQLVRDSFDLLYTTPETIGKLRQAILQLAVQGKLVPQDPADEPAVKLLDRIQAEKARLQKENKIRKADLIPPVTSKEAPYELPYGWTWARVGEVAKQFVDCPHATPHYMGSGYVCLRAPNIVPSNLLLEEIRFVSEDEYHRRIQRLQPQRDDLVYIREGGRLGIAGIITSDDLFCLGQRLMLVRFMNPITASYVSHFLNAPKTYEAIVGKVLGGASPHINVRDVVSHLVPLPPLAEQGRIVAKVCQLIDLCDHLEARLKGSQAKAERMTAAAVQAVFATEQG